MPLDQLRHLLRSRKEPDFDPEEEGLLDGLSDDRERQARADLIRQLAADGASTEEMRSAIAEDRLSLLPLERALALHGEQDFTIGELAERSGVDEAFVQDLRRALGLPRADPDQDAGSDGDVEALERVARFREAGLPDEGLLEIARVLGHGMSLLAATLRRVLADAYLEPGDTELDAALRYAEAASALAPELGPVLEYALAVHQREQVGSEVVGRTERATGRLAGGTEMAVCFADLVGFTELGEEIAPAGLGAVAGRLTDHAVECARPPVRLVKMIGDAALLTAPEPASVLSAALALMDAVETDETLPSLRVGVTLGQAISRGGEWYGTPVNLASKLTAAAKPGQVLATAEVRKAAGPGFRWSKARRRTLPGATGKLDVLEVRRAAHGNGEPWVGYDRQTAKAVLAILSRSGRRQAAEVLEYERGHKRRKTILRRARARAA